MRKLFAKAQDPISCETHALGAVAALGGGLLYLLRGVWTDAAIPAVAAALCFCLSMAALYAASAIYHYYPGTERAHSTFHVEHLTAEDFTDARPRGIIGMVNGEITTVDAGYSDRIDVEYDVLKIAVVERHKNTHHIGIGFLQGYGLKSGAVATSVSHDSHNIIVVGTSEDDCAAAANRVVELNGGIVVWDQGKPVAEVPLAIAGIMSDESLTSVNEKLEFAKAKAHELGVNPGIDPFMTLSFMALPVIPSLRITTRGVFDVTTQSYV